MTLNLPQVHWILLSLLVCVVYLLPSYLWLLQKPEQESLIDTLNLRTIVPQKSGYDASNAFSPGASTPASQS